MFQSSEISKSLTWHATDRKKDGLMRHPADAASWKLVDEKWPSFGADSRNLKLALSTDGFNSFSGRNSKYSCWPVILVIYYLPPWFIMMLTLLISAYGNLSGSIVKSYNACPICVENTKPTRLVNGGRMSIIGSHRWPGRSHLCRRQKTAFNNYTEHSLAPVPLTSEEVLQRVENEVLKYKFERKNGPPAYKGAEDESCMAENYIVKEAVEFLAELFLEDKIARTPYTRDTVDSPASGAHVVSVYGNLFDQAHLCVLQNTNEFRSYFNEHLEFLKKEFPRFRKDQKWLTDKQNKTFADRVKQKVANQMSESATDIYKIVRWLSDKSSNEVLSYNGYKISGTLYTTKGKDDVRSKKNSDELGFTLANLNKKGHFNDTFVLGKCVGKIFYIQDPAVPQWSVVVRLLKRYYSDFKVKDVVTDNENIHQPITLLMSSIELSGSLSDEEEYWDTCELERRI
ncbi:hypothetical protein ACLB2K_020946 [Fragaria x ananassa]